MSETENQENQTEENVVKYETHKRLLDQMKKTQATNAEIQEELERYRQAEREREQKQLEEQGKFQEALQLKSKELEAERQARLEMEADIMRAHKKNAFLSKLGANVKKDEYLNFVNFDEIPLDESGRVDEKAVEEKVNWFKQEHNSLLAEKQAKDAPRDNAQHSGEPKSYMEELKALKESGNFTKKQLLDLMKKHNRI